MTLDERDIIFSRMGYQPDSEEYIDYYNRHPERKTIDDELRNKHQLYSPQTPNYDPILAPAVDANFMFLSHIRHLCEGEKASKKTVVEPLEISKVLKNLAIHYGAMDIGIIYAADEFFYSHRGRHAKNYGETVDISLKNAIVFTVEMAKETINSAPRVSAGIETSKAYVDAAIIGMQLSYYIRNLGYNARCHMDGNYFMPVMPLAVEAGLGEIGRNGLLISRKNGCFVRIGIITTDMGLTYDRKTKLDIKRFCRLCGLCAKTCPAKTISSSDDVDDWRIEQEKCYEVWRNIGNDCGICISSCPIGQDINADEIIKMTDNDIVKFIDEYKKINGTRKRTTGSMFF